MALSYVAIFDAIGQFSQTFSPRNSIPMVLRRRVSPSTTKGSSWAIRSGLRYPMVAAKQRHIIVTQEHASDVGKWDIGHGALFSDFLFCALLIQPLSKQ